MSVFGDAAESQHWGLNEAMQVLEYVHADNANNLAHILGLHPARIPGNKTVHAVSRNSDGGSVACRPETPIGKEGITIQGLHSAWPITCQRCFAAIEKMYAIQFGDESK